MEFFKELRRRSVLRVGAAYLVVGWLVLQFIDVVFPILELDESLGRPILIVLLIGFPIALLLAWSLEITPDGIKRDADVDRPPDEAARGTRPLDRAIVIILTAVLGLLLVERFIIQPLPEADVPAVAEVRENSLAVLPFVNLSGRQEDEYFSDGLTETLLHMLAQVPELKVAARTSVFSFKGKDADVREIADTLGVGNILEGSVQRSGDRVRITAQLIEAKEGFHLWSQNFDRSLDDTFAVQDEIAKTVTGALQATLLESGAPPVMVAGVGTDDAEAYEAYLHGLEQKNLATYSSLPQAENLLKKALALDTGFVDAKLELARVYELQRETGQLTETDAEQRIRPLLAQVLDTRPEDGRALGLLATLDWRNVVMAGGAISEASSSAERRLLRALELSPNEPALYVAMSNVYGARNDPETSLAWTERGLEVDPLSARLHLQRGRILLHALDRADEALQEFAAGRAQAPGWTALIFAAGRAEFQLGNYGDGIAWYLRAMEVDPQDHELPATIARFYYQFGLDDAGDRMFERARAIAPQSAWVRALELERALRADSYERAVPIAAAMLSDGVEDRGEAFSLAVAGYVSSMIELGRAGEVIDFFETLRPGISTPGYPLEDFKDFMMQFMMTLAIAETGDAVAARAVLDPLEAIADRAAPGWRDDAGLLATIALMKGDPAGAADNALTDLSSPLADQLDWELKYRHMSWAKPLLDDPAIATRLEELDAERQSAAEDIRAMLDAQLVTAN